jgi:hypothetical protein
VGDITGEKGRRLKEEEEVPEKAKAGTASSSGVGMAMMMGGMAFMLLS